MPAGAVVFATANEGRIGRIRSVAAGAPSTAVAFTSNGQSIASRIHTAPLERTSTADAVVDQRTRLVQSATSRRPSGHVRRAIAFRCVVAPNSSGSVASPGPSSGWVVWISSASIVGRTGASPAPRSSERISTSSRARSRSRISRKASARRSTSRWKYEALMPGGGGKGTGGPSSV